ncbi:YggU family protein [Geobacter pelophilus]|jgi:uncharacterized protein (TIGR00251 family)|uniref:UPF0235 protein KI809_00455 n=1 Tax=Geoanaerobacter pelophilus TaxID=60036 RepID=A0AAW4KW34_9BACT|nr:DUF167 domain-containing protein [Geoanaerobacter pelophilus]MBT0662761.1 YggU family protein [Geoanaerobacter pelophilus]
MSLEPSTRQLNISSTNEGVTFAVHVQPRASRMEICGMQGDALKVRLTSPPVEDAANRQLEEFIAKTLGIAKSKVSVISGTKSRQKRLLIRGADATTIAAILNEQT